MMIAGSILMGRVLSPIDQLIAVWKQWSGAKLAYRRLDALLQAYPTQDEAMTLPSPKGQVSFEQVSAGPPGQRNATLHQLGFSLSAGEVLGVLGASGSGKSTLARVLVGVWPTLAGTVRLDGADIHRWNRDQLGPHIGYLPQDIELFSGSIAENIARFRQADPQKRSEEHTSELQSLMRISYAVFCLKKKKRKNNTISNIEHNTHTTMNIETT